LLILRFFLLKIDRQEKSSLNRVQKVQMITETFKYARIFFLKIVCFYSFFSVLSESFMLIDFYDERNFVIAVRVIFSL
jgi:hypothetical protein